MNIREEDWLDEGPNLTPMIDVVFLLLIFFMVTTTFLDPERQIEVELPVAESGTAGEPPPNELIVNVDEEGNILLEGRALRFEELVERLKGAALNDPDTPVTIRGHRRADHQHVVRVMDACGLAGISNLLVGTTAEEG